MSRLKRKMIRFLGIKIPSRYHTVFADDTHIVSFPRSGNTWLRFLLGNLVFEDHSTSFANVEDRIPDIHKQKDDKLLIHPRPRMLKSHEYFDPSYQNVIYLCRDPRDVAVSSYYYQLKGNNIPPNMNIDEFVVRLVNGGFLRTETWEEHVLSWTATRGRSERFHFLRYEDLLSDTEMELKKICEFMGWNFSSDRIWSAINAASFDSMAKDEKKNHHIYVGTRKNREDIPFVRSGKHGKWKNELKKKTVEFLETVWGDTMRNLRYL